MKANFRRNVSASTVQILLNQTFSLLVFYFLSAGLSKEDFGTLNWTLSIFLIIFSFLSCGIDQLVIRKIAAGGDKSRLLSLHLCHVFCTGIATFAILLLSAPLFPSMKTAALLLLIGTGKTLLFFSTPFKAVSSGAENFRSVLFMSVSSTLIKCLGIAGLLAFQNLTLLGGAFIFLLADGSELLIGAFLARRHLSASPPFQFKDYVFLLKEAVPQMGVVFFSSAMARMDWLLIGFFLTTAKVAEYSFAYKAFELATLPLLAIAPLLVPAFSRISGQQKKIEEQETVQLLFRIEMIIAGLTSLCMNLIWNPIVDDLTNDKYGAVNTTTVFCLSLTLPVLYVNNFLWSIHFSYGRLRFIFFSFVLCFSVNLLSNLFLIPLLGTTGAAISYLLSIAVQSLYYARRLGKLPTFDWQPFFICSLCALVAGVITHFFSIAAWQLLPFSICVYFLLLLCTLQIRKTDFQILKQVMMPEGNRNPS